MLRAATLLALVLALVALARVEAKSLTGNRVLVIVDDASIRHSHSLFFADLTSTDSPLVASPAISIFLTALIFHLRPC